VANDLWSLAFVREDFVTKANLSAKSTSSFSDCLSLLEGSVLTATLVRPVKARMTSWYCSLVFSSSPICLCRHSVLLKTFRRNESAASFLFGPFARPPLSLLNSEVCQDLVSTTATLVQEEQRRIKKSCDTGHGISKKGNN
jgi:hypothetical protein